MDSQDRLCVLITGGAGYIGSHSAKALARAGYYLVVVDDLRTDHRSSVQWGPLIEADLADKAALNRVFEAFPIAAVIHFSGSAYVGELVADAREAVRCLDWCYSNALGLGQSHRPEKPTG